MDGHTDKQTDALVGVFTDPIIVFDPAWAEAARVMGDRAPEELRVTDLDDWRKHLLDKLKGWLWRQRMKARQERLRQGRAEAQAEARTTRQLGLGL